MVRDKVGDTAGQAVEDTGQSITNVLQTVRLASTFELNAITRGIVRHTAKKSVLKDDTMSSTPNGKESRMNDDEDSISAVSTDSNSSFDSVDDEQNVKKKASTVEKKSELDILFDSAISFDSEEDDDEYAYDSAHVKNE